VAELLPLPETKFWSDLHGAADGLVVEECWKNCNSYCCKSNHKAQDFSLMKCGSAGMVFPEEEYNFLKENGVLQDGHEETARRHEFCFNEKTGHTLKFVTANCDLGGMCSDAKWRPLICKFYPLYPVVTPGQEKIENYTFGSMLDQYWDGLGIEHPCWLYRTKSDVINEGINSKAAPILQMPYIAFYLTAANIFVAHVAANTEKTAQLTHETDPRKFFRDWEVKYLTGAHVNVEGLKIELQNLYTQIADYYGDFLI
jgi:hypothetical protein